MLSTLRFSRRDYVRHKRLKELKIALLWGLFPAVLTAAIIYLVYMKVGR